MDKEKAAAVEPPLFLVTDIMFKKASTRRVEVIEMCAGNRTPWWI